MTMPGGITTALADGSLSLRETFLDALSTDATVEQARIIAGIGLATIYKWRKQDAAFANAWDQRLSQQFKRSSVERASAIPFQLARLAAQHLRSVRHGGWIISPAQNGDWWVGSRRRSAAELLALAMGKGFIPPSLIHEQTGTTFCGNCGSSFTRRQKEQSYCSVSCANRSRSSIRAKANVG